MAFIEEVDDDLPPPTSGSDRRSATSSCSTAACSREQPNLHRHHLSTGITPISTRVNNKTREREDLD
jgi:hypothetical protein